MIRFVDLRTQNTGSRFAFFDTVTEHFIEAAGEQAWDTFDQFSQVYTGTQLERFKGLCPAWAFTPTGSDDAVSADAPQREQPVCDECGKPATTSARDTLRHVGGDVVQTAPVGGPRFGCDDHPVKSENLGVTHYPPGALD